MRVKHSFFYFVVSLLTACTLIGCMKWDYGDESGQISLPSKGLFITCEGNFQYGNASLSFYNPADNKVDNEIFFKANGMKLGDVAQSMTITGDTAWIVVNNSHVVFAVNTQSVREIGRITGLTSPRYLQPVAPGKAYVTQLWDNRIAIVDTRSLRVTGFITVPDMDAGDGSTEQMVTVGQYVYCTCWSHQNRIIRIDTRNNQVVASLEVGTQPRSIAVDSYGYIWVLCDGGIDADRSNPTLCRINTTDFTVDRRHVFAEDATPSSLCTDSSHKKLYWINGGVYTMDADGLYMPDEPLIAGPEKTRFYAMTISPEDGDIYVADAIDYQQPAIVRRYRTDGSLKDKFNVGITAGNFAWK